MIHENLVTDGQLAVLSATVIGIAFSGLGPLSLEAGWNEAIIVVVRSEANQQLWHVRAVAFATHDWRRTRVAAELADFRLRAVGQKLRNDDGVILAVRAPLDVELAEVQDEAALVGYRKV